MDNAYAQPNAGKVLEDLQLKLKAIDQRIAQLTMARQGTVGDGILPPHLKRKIRQDLVSERQALEVAIEDCLQTSIASIKP